MRYLHLPRRRRANPALSASAAGTSPICSTRACGRAVDAKIVRKILTCQKFGSRRTGTNKNEGKPPDTALDADKGGPALPASDPILQLAVRRDLYLRNVAHVCQPARDVDDREVGNGHAPRFGQLATYCIDGCRPAAPDRLSSNCAPQIALDFANRPLSIDEAIANCRAARFGTRLRNECLENRSNSSCALTSRRPLRQHARSGQQTSARLRCGIGQASAHTSPRPQLVLHNIAENRVPPMKLRIDWLPADRAPCRGAWSVHDRNRRGHDR